MTWAGLFTGYEAWARRVRYPASVIAIAVAIVLDVPDPFGGLPSAVFLALLFWIPGIVMLVRNFAIGYRGEAAEKPSAPATAATARSRRD